MIEILPALPSTEPTTPPRRFINLVAMKRYEEWLGTRGSEAQYKAYHFGNLTFQQCHDIALAWAGQRDHEFDTGRGDYYR